MQKTITPKDMRAAEARAMQGGVPALLLMEQAARAAHAHIKQIIGNIKGKSALFFCGRGNNGGDGLAMARMFAQDGGQAAVYLCGEPTTAEAGANLAYARQYCDVFGAPPDALPKADIIVDALLGTGLSRAPEGAYRQYIDLINASGAPVLAVDIPSGLDGESGNIPGACVRADVTVTFHRAKVGLFVTRRARQCAGRVATVDIGLPALYDDAGGILLPQESDLSELLPKRDSTAHKGDSGRVTLVCGSVGMAGAGYASARGALRGGAGLVTLAAQAECIQTLQTLCPCAMCVDRLGALPKRDVLVMGCGMGVTDETRALFDRLYSPGEKTILDADALTLLSEHPRALSKSTIITPHIGEGERLLGHEIINIVDGARELQKRFVCTVALKSDVTCVTDGERTALVTVGTPAQAKGGSGDALCGVTAALYARLSAFDAAMTASLWLGAAAREAEKTHGTLGLLPTETIDALRRFER